MKDTYLPQGICNVLQSLSHFSLPVFNKSSVSNLFCNHFYLSYLNRDVTDRRYTTRQCYAHAKMHIIPTIGCPFSVLSTFHTFLPAIQDDMKDSHFVCTHLCSLQLYIQESIIVMSTESYLLN